MGKDFEIDLSGEVGATPEQVWQAIATGPGISSWFVGRTEIAGSAVRTSFGDDWIPAGTVTDADPGRRFAYRSEPAEDGRFLANEYLIEGRDHSATVVRAVTSGFLPGDDWADEYEAMQYGTRLFFATLLEHLRHFAGRTATPLTLFSPPVRDWPATWQRLHTELGLPAAPSPGDVVTSKLITDGVVYFTNPHTVGVRTGDALYRFIRGLHGGMVLSHALFGPGDPTPWQRLAERLPA